MITVFLEEGVTWRGDSIHSDSLIRRGDSIVYISDEGPPIWARGYTSSMLGISPTH